MSPPRASRLTPADFVAQVEWAKQSEAVCQRASRELRPHIKFGSQLPQFDKAMGFMSDLRENWPSLAELVRTTRPRPDVAADH